MLWPTLISGKAILISLLINCFEELIKPEKEILSIKVDEMSYGKIHGDFQDYEAST